MLTHIGDAFFTRLQIYISDVKLQEMRFLRICYVKGHWSSVFTNPRLQ
jgi:hypothetical protein